MPVNPLPPQLHACPLSVSFFHFFLVDAPLPSTSSLLSPQSITSRNYKVINMVVICEMNMSGGLSLIPRGLGTNETKWVNV